MNYLAECQLCKTILIVDDQPNNLQLLLQYLTNANYKILMAQSGTDAIEIAEVYDPNLILLDVMMPGINGFDTCFRLKNQDSTKDIPIIFMTALSATENQVQGFELGAVDYITKPIEREVLLARVKTHLALQSSNQRLTQELERQKLISKISDRLRQCLDLNSLCQTAMPEIRTVLDCDRVWLANLENSNLTLKAEANALGVKLDGEIPWHDFCDHQAEYLVELKENIRIVNLINNRETNEEASIDIKPVRIIVPILINSSQTRDNTNKQKREEILWGWLIVDRETILSWQGEEFKLLEILTTQLAIGIQQALLYEKITQQISIDSLTQVYNRRYFDQQLSLEWRRLKRTRDRLSLIMCDVDYFKSYNDTYGHQQGDKCLQQIAQAISTVVKRPADILARYGGEEFCIILPQTPKSGAMKVAEAIQVAISQLQIPHLHSAVDSVVTASMGVASTILNSQDSPLLLLEAADLALYEAKERGRNCIAVFDRPISQANDRQNSENVWVERLRQALEYDLFSLYAQPIKPLDIDDHKEYFEVLLRLTDRQKEVVTPHCFLDIAENNSLMPTIDIWVINTLFKQIASQDSNWQNHRFSINLSGASLNSDAFLEFLLEKLDSTHLPGELFCFEITETVAVSDLDKISQFMRTLKNRGCTFALDDFGSGMSSLTYLKKLPVDYLKIDGSFITDLNQNKAANVMVEAINHIAEGIGLKTVAEFVENKAILDTLIDLKIDYAQGFHLGRPKALATAFA